MEEQQKKVTFDKEENSYEFLFGEKIDSSKENSFDVVDFFFSILVAVVSQHLSLESFFPIKVKQISRLTTIRRAAVLTSSNPHRIKRKREHSPRTAL
jgi:hypothetical protein